MIDFTAYLLNDDPSQSDEEIMEQIESQLAESVEPSQIDAMREKIAAAHLAGIKLAREHGSQILEEHLEEKRAYIGPENLIGGYIGYGSGRDQASKGESHSFGVPQVLSLLIPGGAGYQVGRWAGHVAEKGESAQNKLHEQERKNHKEKTALLPVVGALAGTVGRAVAGGVARKGLQSAVGGMAKDVAKNVAVDRATSALTRPRPQMQQAAQVAPGGFKYALAGGLSGTASKMMSGLGGAAKNLAAGGKGPGSLGQKLVGGMVRSPGAAMVGAGMVGGAIMAPRDPVTGEKQYMRGALTGGALGGAATALGGANKLRSAVVNPKGPQILGQGAGAYARDATRATSPAAARAHAATSAASAPAAAAAQHAAPSAASVATSAPQVSPQQNALNVADQIASQQRGLGGRLRGMMGGNVHVPPELQSPERVKIGGFMSKLAELKEKVANRQTLRYSPTTETFTRRHLTPDKSMGPGADIPAGTVEMVMGHQPTGPRGPAPSGLPASRGPSQVYTSHGGDVLSSSPARGVAARPQVTSRPVQAPPPIPSAAMLPKPASGLGGALKAPKPPALPSLAGARSLVKRASLRRHLVEGT